MIKKLGFGCMRLPLLDKNDQTSFDTELLNKMVDTFIEKGFCYFDTGFSWTGCRNRLYWQFCNS